MSIAMSESERQEFLAGIHIGIVSLNEDGRGPLSVPVWYSYEPGGDIVFITPSASKKAGLISEGTRVGFCVQDEELPPKYVTVEGPVVEVREADTQADVVPMASRYLGEELGTAYVTSTRNDGRHDDEVVIRIQPDRWYSADFAKRLAGG